MSIDSQPKLEYLGTWFEIDGRDGERVYKWRPLLDTLRCFIGIKNTGSTVIDHFVWRQTIDLSKAKVSLVHPRLPSQMWRPFVGDALTSVLVRDVRIKGREIEVTNPVLNRVHEALLLTHVSAGGLRPGETLIVGEKKPFVEFLEEGVEAKNVEAKTEARLDIINRDKGIVMLVVKEVKLGPIALHDLRARVTLRGKTQALQEISIDDQVLGTGEVEWEYV